MKYEQPCSLDSFSSNVTGEPSGGDPVNYSVGPKAPDYKIRSLTLKRDFTTFFSHSIQKIFELSGADQAGFRVPESEL